MSSFRIEGLSDFRARLERFAETTPETASTMAGAVCEHVRSVMVERHLNGQNIGRVDHALIDSWSVRKFDTPTAGAVLSSDSPYARAQEFGIQREVAVRAYSRRKPFSAAGLTQATYKFAPTAQKRKFTAARTAFQESEAGAFSVAIKEHSRKMNLTPRNFLRDSIDETSNDWGRIMLEVWRRENA